MACVNVLLATSKLVSFCSQVVKMMVVLMENVTSVVVQVMVYLWSQRKLHIVALTVLNSLNKIIHLNIHNQYMYIYNNKFKYTCIYLLHTHRTQFIIPCIYTHYTVVICYILPSIILISSYCVCIINNHISYNMSLFFFLIFLSYFWYLFLANS